MGARRWVVALAVLAGLSGGACATDGPGERFNRQMREQQCAGYSPGQQPYEDWGCADL